MRPFILACLMASFGFVACGGEGQGPGELARLEGFDDGQPVPVGGVISISLVGIDDGAEGVVSELRFINTGSGDLEITNIEVESSPPGTFRLLGDQLGAPLPAFPLTISPTDGPDGTRTAFIYLMATREGSTTPTGKVRVYSNSVSGEGRTQPIIEYTIEVQAAVPTIQVTPRAVNFGAVPLGQDGQEPINILNPGAAPLIVSGYRLTGHPNFELVIGAERFAPSATTVTFPTPIEVAPGTTRSISVLYTARDDSEAKGALVLMSNDPTARDGTEVPVQANVGGPCITVNPKKVQFGGKLIGRTAVIEVEVESCGDADLELREIGLTDDSSEEFGLELETLPGIVGTPSTIGPADAPVILQPGQTGKLRVTYFPADLSGRDGAGNWDFDLGTLRIRTNMFVPEVLVDVSGIGVEVECPQAVIVVEEGDEVIPQTELHLIGTQSVPTVGANITDYLWEVDQPGSDTAFFAPSNLDPNPTFEVNVAGRYVFRLTVTDSTGEESCLPAEVEVFVNPDEAIHLELLWTTAGDPVEADENGPDLDLHFLHPNAVGEFDGDRDGSPDGWFDKPFDCFWDNKHPDWASFGNLTNDDPGLDRDDTDGLGPENLNLDAPEEGKRYRVGVQVWDDKDMGPSLATLRVFIYGNPVYEDANVELHKYDMWWVTEVAWPPNGADIKPINVCEGSNTRCETDATCGASKCVRKIVPNYQHPEYVH